MARVTSVRLSDEQYEYVDKRCMNVSKFVRAAIDKEMEDEKE